MAPNFQFLRIRPSEIVGPRGCISATVYAWLNQPEIGAKVRETLVPNRNVVIIADDIKSIQSLRIQLAAAIQSYNCWLLDIGPNTLQFKCKWRIQEITPPIIFGINALLIISWLLLTGVYRWSEKTAIAEQKNVCKTTILLTNKLNQLAKSSIQIGVKKTWPLITQLPIVISRVTFGPRDISIVGWIPIDAIGSITQQFSEWERMTNGHVYQNALQETSSNIKVSIGLALR